MSGDLDNRVVSVPDDPPILDQGNTGSSVSHAMTTFMRLAARHQSAVFKVAETDPSLLYGQIFEQPMRAD